jgi:hypothetical protein
LSDDALDQSVKDAMRILLEQLDIRRIIVVDDDLDLAADGQNLIDVKSNFELLRGSLSELAATRGVDELIDDARSAAVDGEDIRDDIGILWARLSNEEKLALVAQLPESDDRAKNLATLDAIRPYFPTRVKYMPLSVGEWESQCETLLGEAHPNTLVFFDRHLSDALGGKRGGDALVRKLYSKHRTGVYSGLLTQDAKDPTDETRISEELRADVHHAVPAIGKYRVKTPEDFVQGLQFFLHITELARVKDHTDHALTTAFAETQEFLSSIGYYVILASAASAHHEGVFEGDGLLRLARAHFRRRTERHLATKPPVDELRLLRKATAAPITEVLPKSHDAQALEWSDRFDSADELSASKSPTEVGDIYELTGRDGSVKHVILLAQACDLIVRKDGERSNAPDTFTLAMLEGPKPGTSPANVGGRLLPVGTLRSDTTDIMSVNLARRVYLPPQVLDACVISTDSSAKFNNSMSHPHAITAGWVKRPSKLKTWAKGRVDAAKQSIELLPEPADFDAHAVISERLYEAAFGPNFVEGLVSLTVNAKTGAVTMGVRRVSRLVESHAKALLVQLSQYQSRPDTPAAILRHPEPSDQHDVHDGSSPGSRAEEAVPASA